MAATVKVHVITDLNGRVLAAAFPEDVKRGKNDPACLIQPAQGQRVVTIDVPKDIAKLSGPDLHRFFNEVHVSWTGAEVRLPEIKIVKRKH